MSEASTLKVVLLTPDVWRPAVDIALAGIEPREARFARALLERLHNRHVGVTPALAVSFARAVLTPTRQTDSGPWAAVFQRLQSALAHDEARRVGRKSTRYGLVFQSNPMYCVERILIPLISRASEQMGTTMLFSEDKVAGKVDADAYDRYDQAMAARIQALAEQEDDGYELFWQELALTLTSFSRKTMARATGVSSMPRTDPDAFALMMRLRTDKQNVSRRIQRNRRTTELSKHREMRNRREGGVDGIHITRRAEDLDGMLLSEFTNPEIILADRMANTGFFSLQRQPRREKMRDVLMGAVLPRQTGFELVGDFIKACWFEAMLHLALMLRKSGMNRSAFRWNEGDPLGTTRQSAFHLSDMPRVEKVRDEKPSEALRREFITALGWMPAFLDNRHAAAALYESSPAPGADVLTQIKQWAADAWISQSEALRNREPRERSDADPMQNKRVNLREFSYVHVMVFLPASYRTKGHAADLGALTASLGLGREEGRSVSVTWFPDRVVADPAWNYETRGGRNRALFSAEEQEFGAPEMANRMVHLWLNQWIKEIWRA